MESLKISIKGVVQGVGFRPFVYKLASELNIKGFITNTSDGVALAVEGDNLAIFIERLRTDSPPLSRIISMDIAPDEVKGFPDFSIKKSSETGSFTLLSPDISICGDCRREMFTQGDRRYLYPFINCTNCGPRYSITESVPYDRINTTMRAFRMCSSCEAEYLDPSDRRFHAQPNACHSCGPAVSLVRNGAGNTLRDGEAILKGIELLRAGKIIAVKGLGGFHIACDGTNGYAVMELRQRKRKNNKPFALMAPDTEKIKEFCYLSPEEEDLLVSRKRPIVLLRKRPDCELPAGIAPNNGYIGFMLPYTPLHYLLFFHPSGPGSVCKHRFEALVMTSGNITEEPLVIENNQAITKLSGIADAFLVHDRDIFMRVDDSVIKVRSRKRQFGSQNAECRSKTEDIQKSEDRSYNTLLQVRSEKSEVRSKETELRTQNSERISGNTHETEEGFQNTEPGSDSQESSTSAFSLQPSHLSFIRRSRGFVPDPIPLFDDGPDVLGCGADLKNTFTIAKGRYAIPSQHIGDMENYETLRFFEETLENLKSVYRAEPEFLAYDLHPGYFSTQWALRQGIKSLGIQHHYAHIASVMAEKGLREKVIGVSFDGTGYGEDGALWGGEFLVADVSGYRRAGFLEYVPLPGGIAAIKEPWRTAVSFMMKAAGADIWEYLETAGFTERYGRQKISDVALIAGQPAFSPLSSGAGRVFDAVAALLGVCDTNTFEGEAAMALESLVEDEIAEDYPVDIRFSDPMGIDFSMTFLSILNDVRKKVAKGIIASKFHNTVVSSISAVVSKLSATNNINKVALSGGVFQNAFLLERTEKVLEDEGFEVHVNKLVPCNDAGISLGQAYLLREKIKSGLAK